MCANFQAKQTTLTFLDQSCPKMDLGLEIQEANAEIRISILEISCVLIFRQNRQLQLFRPKFGQKCPDSESAPQIYHVCQFSVKIDNFEFFDLNLGKFPYYVRYFGFNHIQDGGRGQKDPPTSFSHVTSTNVRIGP